MSEIKSLLTVLQFLLWNPGTGVLIALLIAAAWMDWRTMRIPNVLTVFGMLWGVAMNTAQSPAHLDGFLFALSGLATGLLLFLPLWLIRAMGAGDVKLMAMAGAFLGAPATAKAALVVFVVGGIAAIGITLTQGALGRLVRNLRNVLYAVALPGVRVWHPTAESPSAGTLPYGVSIGLGTLAFLVLRQLGYA